MDLWITAFLSMAPPVLGLGTMIAMGVIMARLRVLTEDGVDALTHLVVALLLPMLLFSEVVGKFRPEEPEFAGWYWLPLAAVGVLALGYSLGWLTHRLFAGPAAAARRITFATLCGWQNAGYIPIPILVALYGDESVVLVYCFLFILGFSPTMWSLGPFNLGRAGGGGPGGIPWRKLVTPPFVANLSAVTLCLLGVPQALPERVLEAILFPLEMVGRACVPLIMVLLGAMLARRRSAAPLGVRFALGLIAVKLVLVPAVMMGLIALVRARGWGIPEGVLSLFLVEAASPTATGLTVIARRYAGEEQSELVNKAVLWSYLAAALTLPLWLTAGRAALGLFASAAG